MRSLPLAVLIALAGCSPRDGKSRNAAPEPPDTLTHYLSGEAAGEAG